VISSASAVFNYASSDFAIEERVDGEPFLTTSFDQKLQYMLIYILVYLILISVFVYFTNSHTQSIAIVDWYFMEDTGTTCNLR
jgi:hypothetical protein